jgi:osmotically-inducible protein OsmY
MAAIRDASSRSHPVSQPSNRPLSTLARAGALLILLVSASGCVAVAVGGGAVEGYNVFAQDMSPAQQMRDAAIKALVQRSWDQFNPQMAHQLDATVYDGGVLITGRLPAREWREEAVRRARQVQDVRQVYDEIIVGPDTHFADEARDSWITTQMRGILIGDGTVKSINYTIKTSEATVYLLGVARSQAELDRVVGHARNIPYVRKVVSFVRIIGTGPQAGPPRPPPPGAEPAGEPTELAPAPPEPITSEPLN